MKRQEAVRFWIYFDFLNASSISSPTLTKMPTRHKIPTMDAFPPSYSEAVNTQDTQIDSISNYPITEPFEPEDISNDTAPLLQDHSSLPNRPPKPPIHRRLSRHTSSLLNTPPFLYLITLLFFANYILLPLTARHLGMKVNICQGITDSLVAMIPFMVVLVKTTPTRPSERWIWQLMGMIAVSLCLAEWIRWPEGCICMCFL